MGVLCCRCFKGVEALCERVQGSDGTGLIFTAGLIVSTFHCLRLLKQLFLLLHFFLAWLEPVSAIEVAGLKLLCSALGYYNDALPAFHGSRRQRVALITQPSN